MSPKGGETWGTRTDSTHPSMRHPEAPRLHQRGEGSRAERHALSQRPQTRTLQCSAVTDNPAQNCYKQHRRSRARSRAPPENRLRSG
jgi:hypothetical protein